MEVFKFIMNGLGDITPQGESRIDNENIKNITVYGRLCKDLIYELYKTSSQVDRPEYSIQLMARQANLILQEIKDLIDEIN